MSKLNNPEHEAYRAQMLAYGQPGTSENMLALEIQRLRVEVDETTRLYLETDAELCEYERRYGKLEAAS